jgi:hypothetical protein
MRKFLIALCFLVVIAESTQAQSFFNDRNNRRFVASFGAGISSYYGDLDYKDPLDGSLNLSFGLKFVVSPQVALRGEFQYYRIAGSDELANKVGDDGTIHRNLSFFANNTEANLTVSYDLLPAGSRYYQRPPISPFVFGGLGLTFYKPKAELNGKSYALRRLRTEGTAYSPVALVLPIGVGVRFKIGPYLNAVLEGGYRKTFTDYLDDVSTTYIDNSSFEDPIAAALADRGPEIGESIVEAGTKRGNPDKDDSYFILSAKIEYFIPSNLINLQKLRKRRPGARRPSNRGFRLFGR